MKECILQYELSVVPEALFLSDGSMHHCLAKYKLTEVLEAPPGIDTDPDGNLVEIGSEESLSGDVAIVDGMACYT